MLVYLLRHAEAEVHAASDAARRLTPKGEEQAARAGKFCRRQRMNPDIILSSPVTRALQTAQAVAACLDDVDLVEVPWAACGMSPGRAIDELGGFAKFASVMLVGHQPDLGELAAVLLGLGNPQALRFRKCALAAIDAGGVPVEGAGVLQFFVPAKLMD